jgi:hypothetical protein
MEKKKVGREPGPRAETMKDIARNLTRSDLIGLNNHLKKTYAFVYALHEIAASDGLQDLGDEDAFVILDEAIVNLQEGMKLIREEVKEGA